LDCGASRAPLGDGCNGGQIDWTLQYAIQNGGLTASDAYKYVGESTGTCQPAADWKVGPGEHHLYAFVLLRSVMANKTEFLE
jgi:hypothetical protein